MKILFGVNMLAYESGIARVTEEMARYLYDRGYDVKIVCGKCDIETKVPIILCKYNEAFYQPNILDVLKIIKQEKPDIFHSHYYPMDLCGALMNSSKTKHVMHSHGVNHQNWRFGWRNSLVLIRADVGEFLGAHFSEKVICVSNYMANSLVTKCKVRRGKIEVVYNAVDQMKFNPSIKGDDIRKRYHIHDDNVVLLYVASIAPRKRQDLLIECMKNVIKKKQNIQLLLVGRTGKTITSYKETLVNKVRNAGLDEHIFFCGYVSDEELPKYYAASDIYVSTSSWEGFGLPFIEAMACGKPVIGFNRTGISELIINGYNGYKVKYPNIDEMAARTIQLANDVEERKTLGMNGRKFVEENFNAKTNMEKIIDIYSQLLCSTYYKKVY